MTRIIESFQLRLGAMALAVLLTGCAANQGVAIDVPEHLTFDPALFGEQPPIPRPAELFALRKDQAAAFQAFFNDPAQQATPAHERIYHYLRSATEDFDFHNDTHTAAQTLDESAGNCLSLAILTTALANLAGVETGYQLVDSTPVFERRGNVVSKGIHVRSILYDPAWVQEGDGDATGKRPGIRFDYFPDDTQRVRVIGNLPYSSYVAMYYSNIAGEFIAVDDIAPAYWYLLESLREEPDNSIALNMLAVVYRRAGDELMAEQIYRYGIESLPRNVSFLRNYRFLLKGQGRLEEAGRISRALARLDDPNPFNWVSAGRSALADGENREAIRFFKQAIELAPYLHEAHALMAIAHLRMGNRAKSEREMQLALENAQRKSTRSLYLAKLTVLQR